MEEIHTGKERARNSLLKGTNVFKALRSMRFRFSLRVLLVLMAFAGAGVGMVESLSMKKGRKHQDIAMQIREAGGSVTLDDTRKWYNYRIMHFFGAEYTRVTNVVFGEEVDSSKAAAIRYYELGTLECIDGESSPITDDVLQNIGKCRELKQLFLASSQVTNDGLAHLSNLSNLNLLQLDNLPITSEGIDHIDDLPSLQFLILENTKIDGRALELLSDNSESIERLFCGGTQLTDDDVAKLNVPTLQMLNLSSPNVTEKSLSKLARMNDLNEVMFNGKLIPEKQLSELRSP